MRRAVAIAAISGWVFVLFLLLPDIKNFLLTHPLSSNNPTGTLRTDAQ
jgi:hypothetical protein